MKKVIKKTKDITKSILVRLHLKKENKSKKFYKKVKKLLKSRDFWIKVIILFSTLALIATSILPYVL